MAYNPFVGNTMAPVPRSKARAFASASFDSDSDSEDSSSFPTAQHGGSAGVFRGSSAYGGATAARPGLGGASQGLVGANLVPVGASGAAVERPQPLVNAARTRRGFSAVLDEEAEIAAGGSFGLSPTNSNENGKAPIVYDAVPAYGVPRGFQPVQTPRALKANMASAQDSDDDSSTLSTPLAFGGPSTSGSTAAQRQKYLVTPAARGRMTQCYVTRERGWVGHFPKFCMFTSDGDQFLLSARRKKKSKTSYYLLSLDRNDVSKGEDVYFGKLRSNYVGTEFVLYDNGTKDPTKAASAKEAALGDKGKGAAAHGHLIREMAAVRFKQTALTASGGPRALTAILPLDDNTRQPLGEGRQLGGEETLVDSYLASKNGVPRMPIVALKNKRPKYDERIKAHTLDFNGRVTEGSTKNFQLCASGVDPSDFDKDDADGAVVLQFGKCGTNTFALDFSWPMSPMQAFAIALSSIDTKLCYVL